MMAVHLTIEKSKNLIPSIIQEISTNYECKVVSIEPIKYKNKNFIYKYEITLEPNNNELSILNFFVSIHKINFKNKTITGIVQASRFRCVREDILKNKANKEVSFIQNIRLSDFIEDYRSKMDTRLCNILRQYKMFYTDPIIDADFLTELYKIKGYGRLSEIKFKTTLLENKIVRIV